MNSYQTDLGKIKPISCSFHRNGVGGEGFYVITFEWIVNSRFSPALLTPRHMIATLFSHREDETGTKISGRCAVLDIDECKKDNIKFANGNSWRGDHFEPIMRKIIQEQELLAQMRHQRL